MRMELSLEVKGYLADIIARESLGKIKIIGMRVGIESEIIESFSRSMTGLRDCNEDSAIHIVENAQDEDRLIETILDIAKRDGIGGKWYTKIFTELNSLMERTMQCRIDKKQNIIPIFDENLQIYEKETFIEKKLEEFGFNKTLTNYKSALKTYPINYKGSISLFRSTFECLVDDIITSKGEPLKSNQKDKLAQLEELGIIKEIDTQYCKQCQYKKRDSEFNYSYDIYSLLSHYGSHKELLTEELANFLFTSTLAFIWFLINRYEK